MSTNWTKVLKYNIATHHHKFAAWAAARAVQRGFTSTQFIKKALDHCEIKSCANTPSVWPATADAFEKAHRTWCRAFISSLKRNDIRATYGRAAKAIAIYLKSRIVLGGHHDSEFAKVLHPPIDRVLLQGLAGHLKRDKPNLADKLRKASWTTWDESDYYAMVNDLLEDGFNRLEFWRIEYFWNPWDDEA